jgi:hypothetical protein
MGRATRDKRRTKKARPQRPAGEATKSVAREQEDTSRPAASSGGWRTTPARPMSAGLTIRAEDYHYVYSDLRRIAVFAVCIFAILIILSFVIK